MLPYNSPYGSLAAAAAAVTITRGSVPTTRKPSAISYQASAQARPIGPARISLVQGETAIPGGGILGPIQHSQDDLESSESSPPIHMHTGSEAEVTRAVESFSYLEPSAGGYDLPADYGFINQPHNEPPPHLRHPPPRPIPLRMEDLQPSAGLVEFPPGSKAYYILECLPCHKAFLSAAGALDHIQQTPLHAEVRDLVYLDEAVDICGCKVVDATEADYAMTERKWRSV
ncbi:uncharacterized protein RAG0_05323 [Rhynchosporium agropyri]|uniref:Uncharacterized protein n=1 Tax=Rhynchosporium agropyri TaxID=914238 RepID=A0A1E1KGA0_9HELO|nr:uncharacterized protein RAG0_05323 [Rhynchosporium agropyri]